jgi:hypothetical protein
MNIDRVNNIPSVEYSRDAFVLSGCRSSSWTGRAQVSPVTDTVLSHLATSGLHRTRVSAMRFANPKASSHRNRCFDASGISTSVRAGGNPM